LLIKRTHLYASREPKPHTPPPVVPRPLGSSVPFVFIFSSTYFTNYNLFKKLLARIDVKAKRERERIRERGKKGYSGWKRSCCPTCQPFTMLWIEIDIYNCFLFYFYFYYFLPPQKKNKSQKGSEYKSYYIVARVIIIIIYNRISYYCCSSLYIRIILVDLLLMPYYTS